LETSRLLKRVALGEPTPLEGTNRDSSSTRGALARGVLRCLKARDDGPVALYPLLHIDRAMDKAGVLPKLNAQGKRGQFVAKTLSRLSLIRNIRHSKSGPVLVGLMGLTEYVTFPFSLWTDIVPLCFDCWPAAYDRWASFFLRHRVRLAFFTARQSAEYFAQRLPHMSSVWIPEATDPTDYLPYPWDRKDIDVLELGRKFDLFHQAIELPLLQAGRSHLYEKIKGQIIFPTRDGFISGMARSKISVCFPSSQTHPERSGIVETLTHRYLESIASRCIVFGHAPSELIDLFGYNPVVESIAGEEYQQISRILDRPEEYFALIEKNYRTLLQVGTWEARVGLMIEEIAIAYPQCLR
jgi:hypothetical protein